MSALHHELRNAREVQGLSQRELARKLDASQANVCRWERGEAMPQTWEKLQRWARVLGYDIGLHARR